MAGAVHAHINRRVPTVAILRCLGCPGHLAAAIYFAQAGALGLFGAVLGAGIGIALQTGVLTYFRDSLPITVAPSPEWIAVAPNHRRRIRRVLWLRADSAFENPPDFPAATLRGGAVWKAARCGRCRSICCSVDC